MKEVNEEHTFAVKSETTNFHCCLVFICATFPAFDTLPKAPFSQAAPAVTYLNKTNQLNIRTLKQQCYFDIST